MTSCKNRENPLQNTFLQYTATCRPGELEKSCNRGIEGFSAWESQYVYAELHSAVLPSLLPAGLCQFLFLLNIITLFVLFKLISIR